MARTVKLDDLFDPKRQSDIIRMELKIANGTPGLKRQISRPRDPEEARLLIRAVCDTVEAWKREGLLTIEGRTWRFRFPS